MICGEITALSFKVRVPLIGDVFCAVKVKEMGQIEAGAMEPQAFFAVTLASEETMLAIKSGALPQFVTLSTCVLVSPGTTLPKFTFHAAGQTEGAAVARSILVTKPRWYWPD